MAMNIVAYYCDAGTPATGLSPILSCWKIDGTVVFTDQSMSEIASGYYKYDFTNYTPANDYLFLADGGITLSNIDRYVYSANDIDQISVGGGAGAIPNITVNAPPSAWTTKQKNKIIKDTKDTKSLLKSVSKDMDTYHTEEINIISKLVNKIETRINETIMSIVDVKKIMNIHKKDFNSVVKKLDDNSKMLSGYKNDLKYHTEISNIDKLTTRLDDIDDAITEMMLSNMDDEDIDKLAGNIA